MSYFRTVAAASITCGFLVGGAVAQERSATPGAERAPSGAEGQSVETGKEMRSGERGGGSGNTGVPGGSPSADGNKTQDSRTTKTRDR